MHKYELYYQIALSKMEEQEQRRRSFDTRASGISAVAVALTGVAMLALRDFDPDLSNRGSTLIGYQRLTEAKAFRVFPAHLGIYG